MNLQDNLKTQQEPINIDASKVFGSLPIFDKENLRDAMGDTMLKLMLSPSYQLINAPDTIRIVEDPLLDQSVYYTKTGEPIYDADEMRRAEAEYAVLHKQHPEVYSSELIMFKFQVHPLAQTNYVKRELKVFEGTIAASLFVYDVKKNSQSAKPVQESYLFACLRDNETPVIITQTTKYHKGANIIFNDPIKNTISAQVNNLKQGQYIHTFWSNERPKEVNVTRRDGQIRRLKPEYKNSKEISVTMDANNWETVENLSPTQTLQLK